MLALALVLQGGMVVAWPSVEDDPLVPSIVIGETPAIHPTPAGHGGGFLENGGQLADDEIAYYSWSPAGGIALLGNGALLTVVGDDRDPSKVTGSNVRVSFEGSMDVIPVGIRPLPGLTNVLRGPDPSNWQQGLRTYQGVVYPGLYQGIDLVYALSDGLLKYELIVHPGADAGLVSMGLEGHTAVGLTTEGDLVISTPSGPIVDGGLVAFYQDSPGEVVDCTFDLIDDRTYGFRLGSHDATRTVVIDPIVYSTFVGGSAGELELPWAGVEVDSLGRAYVAGYSNTTDFPTIPGAFQGSYSGGSTDMFVLRLSEGGDDLEWSTYLGGDGSDYAYDLALDPSDRPVVVGRTNSTDFPTTGGSFKPTRPGTDHEGFITMLAADGGSLEFSTYLGGNDTDEVVAVKVTASGSIHVTGASMSRDLPTTSGALFQNHSGGSFDVFVAKVLPDGSDLVYLTYLGGDLWDIAGDVAVDDLGWAYVVGQTTSSNFTVTNGSYQETLMGDRDAFVTKIGPGGTTLGFSTYVGGFLEEMAEFVEVAANGSIVVSGFTESDLFPVTNGSYQTTLGGSSDGFFLSLDPNGTTLQHSTFLGGSQEDTVEGFDIDDDGNVYLTGRTLSNDFPTLLGSIQVDRAGSYDAYIVKFASDGTSLDYASFLGGTAMDVGFGVALDAGGNLTVVGGTESTEFTTTSGAWQEFHGGRVDVFITRVELLIDLEPPVSRPGRDMAVDQHSLVVLNGNASTDNVAVVNFTWTFTYDRIDIILYGPVIEWTFDLAGLYSITLTVRDRVGNEGSNRVLVRVRDQEDPVAIAPDDVYARQHDTLTMNGLFSHDNVGIEVYTWTFDYNGSVVVLTGGEVDFIFDEAGVYSIELNVTDPEGNWAVDVFTITIFDTTVPVAVAGGDLTVDQFTTVIFNGSASTDNVGVDNLTWQLVYAGIPVALYGPTPEFRFDKVGIFDVNLVVEDAAGNRALDKLRVTVVDITPPVAVVGSDVTVDQGTRVDLDGTGSTDNVRIDEWTWTIVHKDEVTSFVGSFTTFTFVDAGTYEVELKVTDGVGLWDTDNLRVTVRDTTYPVAHAGEDITVGLRENATFDGSASSDNVGIISYTWSILGGGATVTLTGAVATHSFSDIGTYEVTLTVVDASGLSTTEGIEVLVLDTEYPIAVINPSVHILEREKAFFNGANSTDNVGIRSYSWSFVYNQALKELDGAQASHTFQLKGNYTVTLTVTDTSGNTATATTWVDVAGPDDGDGGGPISDALDPVLLLAILVIAIVLVIVLAVGLRIRSSRLRRDFGWAPSEEERMSREDGAEGKGDGTEGDGTEDEDTEEKKDLKASQEEAEIEAEEWEATPDEPDPDD
jgi:PKD repeat protein